MINDENKFNLIQKLPITPEQINNIDINELSSTNNISAINLIINDLCNEEFEKNKNFQFTNEELKIIKNYQIITQYMVQSINKLTRKSEELNFQIKEQIQNNDRNEEEVRFKKDKIEEQEKTINEFIKEREYLEDIIKRLNSQEQKE